jgi:hypothetical protein
MINWQPNDLEDDLVKLLPLKRGDLEALYSVASDPLIWEQHPANDRHEFKVFRKFFDDAMNTGSAFSIIDSRTNAVIGSTRYYDYDTAGSSICIGYTFLARRYWGGEYNSSVKTLMIDYAFWHVDRIRFHIGAGNIRSQKATAKLGAVKTGEFTTLRNGKPQLNFEFTLGSNEWRKYREAKRQK